MVERVLLSDRFADRGLIERGAVRDMISRHVNRQQNHTFMIMALLIFELGQRMLVDGEHQPIATQAPAVSVSV